MYHVTPVKKENRRKKWNEYCVVRFLCIIDYWWV